MSWKVASSVQKIVVGGPWSNGLPLFGYCRMHDFVFYFIEFLSAFY